MLPDKIEFKRHPINGLLYILLLVIFTINGFIKLSLDPTGAGGIFFFMAALFTLPIIIWLFKTPYAVIDCNKLTINSAPLNKKTATLSDVATINKISNNKVDLYLKNGREVSIKLSGMKNNEKSKFFASIHKFVQ